MHRYSQMFGQMWKRSTLLSGWIWLHVKLFSNAWSCFSVGITCVWLTPTALPRGNKHTNKPKKMLLRVFGVNGSLWCPELRWFLLSKQRWVTMRSELHPSGSGFFFIDEDVFRKCQITETWPSSRPSLLTFTGSSQQLHSTSGFKSPTCSWELHRGRI